MLRTRPGPLLILAVLLGIPLGLGGYTFVYAKGFSYLSTDPRACVNCHIMNDQYDAWRKSGHRHAATCVECHLPAKGLAKWTTKADQGFRHSLAFTLQNFKEPIEITPRRSPGGAGQLSALSRPLRPRRVRGPRGTDATAELHALSRERRPRRRRMSAIDERET